MNRPSNQLFDVYFTSAPMREVFSDRGRVQGMLDFETALAHAQAKLGIIPAKAVTAIAAKARAELFDIGPMGGWAIELQGLFLFGSLAILLLGAGRYSVGGLNGRYN